MPKPRKEENQDALVQIFDFIFTEAQKPPDKRKPVKITGISGQNELTDALAAALEKPGVFLSDQILETFNEALDQEVARINTNEQGSANVKFTTGNLLGLLNDPNAYMQKGFDNAKVMRKQMRAQYLGKMMQHVVAEGWAKKYNLDLDVRDAIRGSFEAKYLDKSLSKEERAKSYDTSNAIGAAIEGRFYSDSYPRGQMKPNELNLLSEKDHLVNRSYELVGREVFGKSVWENLGQDKKKSFENVQYEWRNMSPEKRDAFKRNHNNSTAIQIFFRNNFGNAYDINKFDTKYKNLEKNFFSGKDVEFWDRDMYLKLETRNIDSRIGELRDYANRNNLQGRDLLNVNVGIQRLEQAKIIVNGQSLNLDTITRAKVQINQTIESYKQQIIQARASGNRDTVRLYQRQIKDLKMGARELSTVMLWGKVGQIEGYVNSFNSIYANGNFAKAFLDGTFFDPNRNTLLRPSKKEGLSFGKKIGEVKVFVAEDSRNPFINLYNSSVTPLYYLTPKSILKTVFVNGEGFVYLALQLQKNLKTRLKNNLLNDNINIEKLLSSDPKLYLESLLGTTNPAVINKYLKQMKSLRGMSNAAKFFSYGQRMRDKVGKFFEEKIFKALRRNIYKALRKSVSDGARKVLASWVAKGGIQTLVKGLVIALANALGFATTGGLANIVITIAASLLVDVLYGIIKVIALVVVFAFVGLIGLVFMLGSKSTTKYAQNSYAYTTVVPGEVVTNPNFRGLYPIDDGEIPGELLPFNGGSLPDGVQCLLGAQSYRCTQSAYGSFSHATVPAIDIGGVSYFYAPTFCGNDNCVVTTVMDVNCSAGYAGGMVIFTASYGSTTYSFKLIHVSKDVSVGQKLSAGEAVARIMTMAETTSACSTGPHLHLEVKANGSSVNPMDVMTGPTSEGGFACNISACPK